MTYHSSLLFEKHSHCPSIDATLYSRVFFTINYVCDGGQSQVATGDPSVAPDGRREGEWGVGHWECRDCSTSPASFAGCCPATLPTSYSHSVSPPPPFSEGARAGFKVALSHYANSNTSQTTSSHAPALNGRLLAALRPRRHLSLASLIAAFHWDLACPSI